MQQSIIEVILSNWGPILSVGSVVAFGASVRVRLQRIEEVLLNGGNGLIRRTENTEKDIAAMQAVCNERHAKGMHQ